METIEIDVSETCGDGGPIATRVEEFILINDIWDDRKDDIFMKIPPYQFKISSPNFELIFVRER